MITENQLMQILPNLPALRRQLLLPHLNAALTHYALDTWLRTAAFIAQLAHESGEFRWMEEIWGPTPAQRRYEPVGDLATRLGNTRPGDGKRFKGRGPIQITGRFNYQRFGGLLGLDLVGEPALAARPDVAFDTAGLFWMSNGLNELADARQFVTIMRRINGGTNGLADRQKYYERAKAVLAPAGIAMRGAPLTRGHEAIVADAKKREKAEKARKAGNAETPAKPVAPNHATPRKAVKTSKAAKTGNAAGAVTAVKTAGGAARAAASKHAPSRSAASKHAASEPTASKPAAPKKAAVKPARARARRVAA